MRKFFLAAVLVLMASGAQATLIDRGEGFIYDDVLDITWAQDANINGSASWDDQMAWAAGYSQTHSAYGTFADWRLPTTLIPDSTCDGSFGPDTGYGCTGSEMGHLFNVDGISYSSMGLFTNLLPGLNWSATLSGSVNGRMFSFGSVSAVSAAQKETPWYQSIRAMAVRDGDIVPEPSTALLVGIGLVGIAARRRA